MTWLYLHWRRNHFPIILPILGTGRALGAPRDATRFAGKYGVIDDLGWAILSVPSGITGYQPH